MQIKVDTHTHTLASGHAYNTMREMAETALEKGWKLLRSRNTLRKCREAAVFIIFKI